jgi:SAM-dependent methyltransferase
MTTQQQHTHSGSRFGDALARALSWRPAMIAEPAVFDRWRWLRKHAGRGRRTLDAGCGSGWFALYLATLGNDVLGVSFNPVALAAAERRARALDETKVRFIEGDLRELEQFGPSLGTFEQIICFETIEHIMNDAKLVADLADRLEPGGRLLLTTPSDDHAPVIGETLSETEDGGHVRFGYSHARLRELCTAAGLEVTTEDRLTGWLGMKLYNATGRLAPFLGHVLATVVTVALRPLQLLDRPLNRVLRRPEFCVAIIAEKPRDADAIAT